MNNEIIDHYCETGTYTYSGLYKDYFKSLPNDIAELVPLINSQFIPRNILREGNTGLNQDLKFGDMNNFPWHRLRNESDIFTTVSAVVSELFRLDSKGFTLDREVENKLVLGCHQIAILTSAILKAKNIPCRTRVIFADYFIENKFVLHWINQYWDKTNLRWVTIDPSLAHDAGFNPYDMPIGSYECCNEVWLQIRYGKIESDKFMYAGGIKGLNAAVAGVFYDFHSLMNNDIPYTLLPAYIYSFAYTEAIKTEKLNKSELKEIDDLCKLMQEPDKNFRPIKHKWNTIKKFRILNSPQIDEKDHLT